MNKIYLTIILILGITFASAQTVVTKYPTKDAACFSATPDMNFGNSIFLAVQNQSGANGYAASLLFFNLSSIPSDATILSANLRLYCFNNTDGVVLRIERLEETPSWTETGVTWNNMPYGTFPPPPYYFEILHTQYESYDVKEIVQGWVSETNENNGFQLITTTSEASATFYSNEQGNNYTPKLIISYLLPEGDLDVYVHNVNGNTVSGANVKLYDQSWNFIGSDLTNSSGRADFNNLPYGIYNYEAYYDGGDTTEFWGSDENFSINSPNVSRNFTRNWPYLFDYSFSPPNPNVGEQVTIQITVKNSLSFSRNVKVELWIDQSQTSPWDFHQLSSSQSISGGGTKIFTFHMTPSSVGTYNWKAHVQSYNDGASEYIVTDTHLWSTAFIVPVQVGDLDIYIHNVNGNTVPNVNVKLYDQSWNLISSDLTNSSGRADFNNLPYGIYNYEAYYDGGDTTEFWGSDENFSINSPNVSRNFTRNWPYLNNYSFSPANPNIGEQDTIQITVKNSLSFSRNVKVELWIDKNQTSPWDFHQLSSSQSVSGGGTKIFTFHMTPSSAGTYNWKAHIQSYNDGASAYIVTDTYPWSSLVVLSSTDDMNSIPSSFCLLQNYPNPFNPYTTISYQIPEVSHVILKVYDIIGRELKVLVNDENTPGEYKSNFNASNLASGIYFYRIEAKSKVSNKHFTKVGKMILLK